MRLTIQDTMDKEIKNMESNRQKKVSRLLQKELGIILQQKGRELGGKMISVTTVRISPDLGIAKVYLSIFPPDKKDEENTLDLVINYTSRIRNELGQKVKNQLRVVPELTFFEDDSLNYIDNIDKLLKK